MSVSTCVRVDFSENLSIFKNLKLMRRSRAASESSTSLRGGNLVDGLPPAPSLLLRYPGFGYNR